MTGSTTARSVDRAWPALPLSDWEATYHTLHMWTQIVGKIRMAATPKTNHWWNVTLRVNTRGLTTMPMPYGERPFEIAFDFIEHHLDIITSDGATRAIPLAPKTVAAFYRELMAELHSLGIDVNINTAPQEVADPIPFESDERHASYDPEYAQRFARILLSSSLVLEEFRSRFIGKTSPVHFYWGSFDLACTRFSGRPAPPRKGVITSEAYSHECISAGWWPGGGEVEGPAFYCYTAPEPPGLAAQPIEPRQAFYHPKLREFLLMYDEVRRAPSPEGMLLAFLQSAYEAGANLANWDRKALER